jgi:hypothetical protein
MRKEVKQFGLSDDQKMRLLKVRVKNWDKPVSLWKKMKLNKGQMTFTGKS